MKFLVSVLSLAAVSTFSALAVAQSAGDVLVAENNPQTFANTQANEEEKNYEATVAKDQISNLMKRTASTEASKKKSVRKVASVSKLSEK